MNPNAAARDHLCELARAGASGELICAGATVEVHVFLQDGSIAWATDSTHPFAFARHIQRTQGIDAATFRQVVEECRRERLQLGETLVAWGLVPADGIRQALRHQIQLALAELVRLGSAQTLFLRRSWRYDSAYTFSLEEFGGFQTSPLAMTGALVGQTLTRRLTESLEGLAWVELFDGRELMERTPARDPVTTPTELLTHTVLSGADFVALRSTGASLAGLALNEEGRSLWCGIEASSTFGNAVASLLALGRAVHPLPERPLVRSSVLQFAGGDGDDVMREVQTFMERAPEVLAAVVLSEGAQSPAAGFCSPELNAEDCLQIVDRRKRCFTIGWPTPAASSRLPSFGYRFRTVATGEAHLWCFGAELYRTGESLWIFLDRSSAQGMGWACLASLCRSVVRLGAGDSGSNVEELERSELLFEANSR